MGEIHPCPLRGNFAIQRFEGQIHTNPLSLWIFFCWQYRGGRLFLTKKYQLLLYFISKARSSGGERYLDAVEVDGSKPSAPTIIFLLSSSFVTFLFRQIQAYRDNKYRDLSDMFLRIPKEEIEGFDLLR